MPRVWAAQHGHRWGAPLWRTSKVKPSPKRLPLWVGCEAKPCTKPCTPGCRGQQNRTHCVPCMQGTQVWRTLRT